MTTDLSGLAIDEQRFIKERNAMAQHIPEASLKRFDSDQYPVGWTLSISVAETEYDILVAYHQRYPHDPPAVFVLTPDLDPTTTPHMLEDGQLSFRPAAYDWNTTSTAVTAVLLADDWFRTYEGVQIESEAASSEDSSQLRPTASIATSEFTRDEDKRESDSET